MFTFMCVYECSVDCLLDAVVFVHTAITSTHRNNISVQLTRTFFLFFADSIEQMCDSGRMCAFDNLTAATTWWRANIMNEQLPSAFVSSISLLSKQCRGSVHRFWSQHSKFRSKTWFHRKSIRIKTKQSIRANGTECFQWLNDAERWARVYCELLICETSASVNVMCIGRRYESAQTSFNIICFRYECEKQGKRNVVWRRPAYEQ